MQNKVKKQSWFNMLGW